MPDYLKSESIRLATSQLSSFTQLVGGIAQNIYGMKVSEQLRSTKALIDTEVSRQLREMPSSSFEVEGEDGNKKQVGLSELTPKGLETQVRNRLATVWQQVSGGEKLLPEAQSQLSAYFKSLEEPTIAGAFSTYTEAFNRRYIAKLDEDADNLAQQPGSWESKVAIVRQWAADAVKKRAMWADEAQKFVMGYMASVQQRAAFDGAMAIMEQADKVNDIDRETARQQTLALREDVKAKGGDPSTVAAVIPKQVNSLRAAEAWVAQNTAYWAATPEKRTQIVAQVRDQYTVAKALRQEKETTEDTQSASGLIDSYFIPGSTTKLAQGIEAARNATFNDPAQKEHYISLFASYMDRAVGKDAPAKVEDNAAAEYATLKWALSQGTAPQGPLEYAPPDMRKAIDAGAPITPALLQSYLLFNWGTNLKDTTARSESEALRTELPPEFSKLKGQIWDAATKSKENENPISAARASEIEVELARQYRAGELTATQAAPWTKSQIANVKVEQAVEGLLNWNQGPGSGVNALDSEEAVLKLQAEGLLYAWKKNPAATENQLALESHAQTLKRKLAIEYLGVDQSQLVTNVTPSGSIQVQDLGTNTFYRNNLQDKSTVLERYNAAKSTPDNEVWEPVDTRTSATDLRKKVSAAKGEMDQMEMAYKVKTAAESASSKIAASASGLSPEEEQANKRRARGGTEWDLILGQAKQYPQAKKTWEDLVKEAESRGMK